MRVQGVVDGHQVEIERPIEFFIPAGQRDEGQQWISSNMRLLSMVARSGGSISKALANMREVVWDKGPVRYGVVVKQDGSEAPRFHDSEVAAIGYELQQVLAKRGFLDSLGNQVPVAALARRLAQREGRATTEAALREAPTSSDQHGIPLGSGKKCPECGAHAVHKRDGCQTCSSCGWIGACG